MVNASELEGGWEQLLSRLGSIEDLEASAKASGALLRRREIKNAGDLLRLALAYGPCGMSLRTAAAWAHTMGLGDLSDVAALKRLRGCARWLQGIVGNLLERRLSCQSVTQGRRVRLVDGTTISERGSGRGRRAPAAGQGGGGRHLVGRPQLRQRRWLASRRAG